MSQDTETPAVEQSKAPVPIIYTPALRPTTQTNETTSTVLAARARAEIEARTIVAMNRPRNVDGFRTRVLAACERTGFAETAVYSKPVGGSQITGLSIRFAEECVRHYANLDVTSFVVSEDDDRRVIKVSAVDLESNNSFSTDVVVTKTVERKFPQKGDEVIRVRLNKKGEQLSIIRADDDALLTKQNALIAKAQREVILKHIPSDVKEEAEENIQKLLKSKVEKDPQGEKKKIIDSFFAVGVMPEQLAEFIGHSLDAVTPAELHLLRQVYRGVKDEGATWADVMEAKRTESGAPKDGAASAAPAKGGGAALKTALGSTGATASAAAPQATSSEPAPAAPAAGSVCVVCGGRDGKHKPDCKYYAD